MSEIKDMVIPMLQKLQQDVSAGFKRVDGKVTNIAENIAEMKDELDAIKGYVTFQMGLTSQQQSNIDDLRKDIADLKRRISALEGRS
jgi:archaellum component FlaC